MNYTLFQTVQSMHSWNKGLIQFMFLQKQHWIVKQCHQHTRTQAQNENASILQSTQNTSRKLLIIFVWWTQKSHSFLPQKVLKFAANTQNHCFNATQKLMNLGYESHRTQCIQHSLLSYVRYYFQSRPFFGDLNIEWGEMPFCLVIFNWELQSTM